MAGSHPAAAATARLRIAGLTVQYRGFTAVRDISLEIPERESKLLYFVAVDNARFRRPVVPGDQLKLEIKVVNWRGGDFAKLEGRATVDGNLCAEATLMCKMVDREPKPAAEAKAKTEAPKAEQPKA